MIQAMEWLRKQGSKDLSKEIPAILYNARIDHYIDKQQLHALIELKGVKFFICFFRKGGWSYGKRFQGEPGTGCDRKKYDMFLDIQRKTKIQVAFVIWNESENCFIFKPLDQLPKPSIAFKGMKKTSKPEITMWPVDEFAREVYVQPKLI